MMKTQSRFIVLLLISTLCGCNSPVPDTSSPSTDASESDSPPLVKVSLMLNWFPEAEHGGYYAALVHGYYKEQGLDVTIEPGGPTAPVIQQVARGKYEFGVTNADRIVTARAQEAKLKAVFAPMANSPRCLLVHADSGITDFEQLKDVTLMMKRENAWAQFLIKRFPLDGVDVVPNTAGLGPFLADKRAVKQGYIISEPFTARSQGAEVNTLLVADTGFNPYTSILMTRDEYAAEHPAIVRKMVTASLKGWRKYLEAPEETNAHIHDLNDEMSLEILAFGVEAIKAHCIDAEVASESFGSMKPSRWSGLITQLEELDMIAPNAVDPASLHTNTFLLSQ